MFYRLWAGPGSSPPRFSRLCSQLWVSGMALLTLAREREGLLVVG